MRKEGERSREAPLPAFLPPWRAVTSWQPRTAGSDPPIAQAFITCLGPSTPLPALPASPPSRGGAEGAERGERRRRGGGGPAPLSPRQPQPFELVTASGRRTSSPGYSRLLPPLPFRLPGRPPRSGPPGRARSHGTEFLPSPRAVGIRLLGGGGSGSIPGTLSPRRRPRRLFLPAGLSPLSGPQLPSAPGRRSRSPVPPLRSLPGALDSVMAAAELPRLSLR